nr:hypothetical protein [Gammaproteobacteria bacterium]
AFFVSAAGALLSTGIAWRCMPHSPRERARRRGNARSVWNIAEVLRNRRAMGYVLAYAGVIWATSGVRHWLVVFLQQHSTASAAAERVDIILFTAATASLLGVPAGLIGNELSIRYGLRRTAIALFLLGAMMSFFYGFVIGLSFGLAIVLTLFYSFIIQGNVSNLTTGTIDAATEDNMGLTMSVHSCIGFCGGIFGPLIFGWMLDSSPTGGGWALAFSTTAAACLFGAVSLFALATQRRG